MARAMGEPTDQPAGECQGRHRGPFREVAAAVRGWPASLLRLTLATTDDRNAWNLCVEVFWATILTSVASFNAAYALRLGAENRHIGLLTSLPALMAAAVSVPAGRFLERRSRRKAWVLGSLFVHRLGYLLVAALPWVPLGGLNRGAALVVLLVVLGLPAHLFNVGFHAMLAEVIPPRRRAAVVATRSTISVATTSLGLFLVGQWLARVRFPINYGIAFLGGCAAAMVSTAYLYRVRVPDAPPSPAAPAAERRSLGGALRALCAELRAQPLFVRFTTSTLVYNLAAWAVAPLYVLYYVRERGADEGWLGLLGTVSSVASIVGYVLWRRLIARWGELPTLRRTVAGAGLFPILAGLSPTLTPILFAAGLDGLIVTGINLSHYTSFLRVVPEERRTFFVGLYITVMNIGAFIAPLVGVALASRVGLAPVIVGCGLCRALASLMFSVWSLGDGRAKDSDADIIDKR
jgi:MFS family permease